MCSKENSQFFLNQSIASKYIDFESDTNYIGEKGTVKIYFLWKKVLQLGGIHK